MLIIIVSFLSNKIYAQPSGEITGKVVDKLSQQPLIDATVSVIQNEKVLEVIKTDINGSFKISYIPVSSYTLRFNLIGYVPLLIDNIVVRSGSPVNVLADLNIISTDEIIVREERFSTPTDISNSYKSLYYEEIRSSPGGFEDVGRVLQTLPGVSFVNDGRNDLIVRGGSPSENLFLIDNTVVPNINHFGSQGATGGPISIINLNLVREVDFITGGFSARYGDKLSSVLLIKLREGNREKFFGDINLSATGFGGVFEGPLGSRRQGAWLFSIKRSYFDLIFNALSLGFIPEYTSIELKAVYDLNKKNMLTLNAIGNIDKVRFNNDDLENLQDNENYLKNNQKGYVNSYELKSILSKKSFAIINFARTFNSFDYSARDSLFTEVFKNRSKEGEINLKTEYFLLPSLSTQLQFGGGWRFVHFTNDIKQDQDTSFYINPLTSNAYILPSLNISADNSTVKAFIYTQVTQTLFNRLKLNVGIRYDYFKFINDKNYFSPRASLTIPLTKVFNVSFAYGIFYQSPSYIWLIANDQNRDLKNIRSDHYIAGVEFFFSSDLRMTLETYYKKYSNYPTSSSRPFIILSNNGGNFEQKDEFGLEPLVSAGTGFSRGIEFFLQKALTANFYGIINFSLFEAKYKALDGVERESDFNNKFLLTILGGYKFGSGWEASAKFRLAGGRPYTPINPLNGERIVSQYNTARLPDFYRVDMRVDKRWNFKSWSLTTYIDIQNVLNRENITDKDWNKYGNYIEEKETIGILPSIGINVQF